MERSFDMLNYKGEETVKKIKVWFMFWCDSYTEDEVLNISTVARDIRSGFNTIGHKPVVEINKPDNKTEYLDLNQLTSIEIEYKD